MLLLLLLPHRPLVAVDAVAEPVLAELALSAELAAVQPLVASPIAVFGFPMWLRSRSR